MNKIIILILAITCCQTYLFAQDNIYIGKNASIRTFPKAQMAVFGDIINDSKGGLNHNNGGEVYIFRHSQNGKANSRVIDGPYTGKSNENYNKSGVYCRFWNLHTDNNILQSIPSGTKINKESGSGNIEIGQEVRVSNIHFFDNGIVWTPRNKWKNAFIHYDTENASYIGNDDSKHIDGYAAKTGSSDFIFPIGDGRIQRACGISNPENAIYKCAYFNKNPFDGTYGLSGNTIQTDNMNNPEEYIYKVCGTEFWDIDGTASTKIILSANNQTGGYSDWADNFADANPKKIVIAGYNGNWRNLSITDTTKLEMNSKMDFISEKGCVPDSHYSLFTWASTDSTRYSVVENNIDCVKYIRLVNYRNAPSDLQLNYSFGYSGNGKLKIYDFLGKEIESDNLTFTDKNNTFQIKQILNNNNLYLIVLITDNNDILNLKFIY